MSQKGEKRNLRRPLAAVRFSFLMALDIEARIDAWLIELLLDLFVTKEFFGGFFN